ncbi:MAG: hypothetical protein DRJ65_11715 [Acidobacteria bacterium]|nr:MAG: hypothetical protein DRJ65_11715 [Acidobacteriota bacterium]
MCQSENYRTLPCIAFLVVGSLISISCSHARIDETTVIATWSGGTVSSEEYESWLDFRHTTPDEAEMKTTCDALLLVKVLASETDALGVDTATAKQIEDATDAILVKRLRRNMGSEITIPDEEIEAAVRKFPNAFHKPQKLRLRNLFLSYPPGASEAEKEAVQKHMTELRRRLEEGMDFGMLAEQESHSQTRFSKGLIGNVAPGQLPEPINTIAMSLTPGEVSKVIESPDGLTILKCDRLIEARVPSPDEIRNGLAKNLRRIEEKRRWQALTLELGGGDASGPAFKKAAAEQARDLGLDRNPETVTAIIWTRRQYLATEAIRRRVEATMTIPTQTEVRQYFDSNRDLFTRPETFELSVIRLDYGDGDRSAVHRKAADLSHNLRNGRRDFAEAARTNSDDASASIDGRLASMTRRQMAGRGPEFMKTVSGLDKGHISREFTANGSQWIVRLDDRQPARPATFEEASNQAREKLGQDRVAALQETIENDIRASLDVVLTQ